MARFRRHFRRRINNGTEEKQCTACEQWKSLADFPPRPGRPELRRSWCKPCFAEQSCLRYEGAYAKKSKHGSGTVTTNGYRMISKAGNRVLEHRAVWEEAHGPITKGCDVHHINEIKTDNRLENLEILSKSVHSKMHGDQRLSGAKITPNDVRLIRELRSHGARLRGIAAIFGLTTTTISQIAHRKTWKDVV